MRERERAVARLPEADSFKLVMTGQNMITSKYDDLLFWLQVLDL